MILWDAAEDANVRRFSYLFCAWARCAARCRKGTGTLSQFPPSNCHHIRVMRYFFSTSFYGTGPAMFHISSHNNVSFLVRCAASIQNARAILQLIASRFFPTTTRRLARKTTIHTSLEDWLQQPVALAAAGTA